MKIKKFENFTNDDNGTDKMFLVYDLSGRSAKPYKLDKGHIEKTWDLDEEDDDEVILMDYLNDCEDGDVWRTGTVKMVCLGVL